MAVYLYLQGQNYTFGHRLTKINRDICTMNLRQLGKHCEMENKRQKQISRQIQKDLGEIFQKDFKEAFGGAFITITDVKISPDLGVARVYLSFLMVEDKEALLETIKDNSKKIRGLFGNRVRNQFRVVPNFQFFLDDTAEYAQKMNELFSNLEIPPAPEDDDEDDEIYTR